MNKSHKKILFLVQFALLIALEVLFCFTPLGSIPIGPVVATLMMVPVIVCSLCMGPIPGLCLGFLSGLFSFIVNSFVTPTVTSFMFTPVSSFPGTDHGSWFSLVICFLPRTLAGFLPGLIFEAYNKGTKLSGKKPNQIIATLVYAGTGCLVSLINTAGVLGLFWAYCDIFQKNNEALHSVLGTATVGAAVWITVLTNGIPEAVLAAIVGATACRIINKYIMKK